MSYAKRAIFINTVQIMLAVNLSYIKGCQGGGSPNKGIEDVRNIANIKSRRRLVFVNQPAGIIYAIHIIARHRRRTRLVAIAGVHGRPLCIWWMLVMLLFTVRRSAHARARTEPGSRSRDHFRSKCLFLYNKG